MTLPYAALFIASGALHIASALTIAGLLLTLRRALRARAESESALREVLSAPIRVVNVNHVQGPRWTDTVGLT